MQENHAALQRFIEEAIPFNVFLGLRLEQVKKGFARMVLPYREVFLGDVRRPALHGGILSTLIDTCGGVAAWSYCEAEDKIATVDMRVDYLLPGPPVDLAVEAQVERLGNRVAVVSSAVYQAAARKKDKKAIAVGRAVYNIRRALD